MVLTIMFGTLAAVLLERLQHNQEYAEKTSMEVTVRNMRSGLRLRVAELMMADRMREVGGLLNENPINWLERSPPNYIGQLSNAQQVDIPRGCWYFDMNRQELVYLPYHHRFFESHAATEGTVRFRVTAITRPKETGDDDIKVEGLSLVLVTPYK